MIIRMIAGSFIGIIIGLILAIGSRIDGFFLTNMLDQYELKSYDSRMKLHARKTETSSIDSIVVIDIDQNSILDLGNFKDWPQAYHGQLIDVVDSGKPNAIIFDVIFDPESNTGHDLISDLLQSHLGADSAIVQRANNFLLKNDPNRFVNSTRTSKNVFHSLVFENSDSLNFMYKMSAEPLGYDYKDHLIHLPEEQALQLPSGDRLGNTYVELMTASKGVGSANFPQDVDGVIRRAPTAIYFEGPGHVYPSLTMAAAMHILGVPADGFEYDFKNSILNMRDTAGTLIREIPIDDQGRMYVNFSGYFKTFYYLPYSYSFDPELLQPEYWKDRIAIIGSSLPGLMDLKNTPVQESFSGVEIHANVLYSLIHDTFIKNVSTNSSNLAIVLLSSFVGMLTTLTRKPIISLPLLIAIVLVWFIYVYTRFWVSLEVWEIVRPIIAGSLSFVGGFLYIYLITEKDKRFLRTTFSTYISPTLIDQMYSKKKVPSLGGDEGYHTALFSDIQNFSGFSETLSAAKLVELLNEYLSELTDVLLNNNGTLDKYIGDAIIAFYGAPLPVDNQEFHACLTALQMQTKLKELRNKWSMQGERWPTEVHEMRCRIGVNSGRMVTGNMGSNMRMNYTMMGDTVNIASRLEAAAKQYGVYILVGENTYEATKNNFEWRKIDYVCVKGKSQPIKVYELLSEKGHLDEKTTRLVSIYQDGIKLFYEQKWDDASAKFRESEKLELNFEGRHTNPSRMLTERCILMKKSPPGPEWDKVWYLSEK
jgi:class 3 adenylate cyclase/CHASE2 domain-containing sensor protein